MNVYIINVYIMWCIYNECIYNINECIAYVFVKRMSKIIIYCWYCMIALYAWNFIHHGFQCTDHQAYSYNYHFK